MQHKNRTFDLAPQLRIDGLAIQNRRKDLRHEFLVRRLEVAGNHPFVDQIF